MEIRPVDNYYISTTSSVYNYAILKTPADDNKVSEVDNTNPVEEVHDIAEALLVDVFV